MSLANVRLKAESRVPFTRAPLRASMPLPFSFDQTRSLAGLHPAGGCPPGSQAKFAAFGGRGANRYSAVS